MVVVNGSSIEQMAAVPATTFNGVVREFLKSGDGIIFLDEVRSERCLSQKQQNSWHFTSHAPFPCLRAGNRRAAHNINTDMLP